MNTNLKICCFAISVVVVLLVVYLALRKESFAATPVNEQAANAIMAAEGVPPPNLAKKLEVDNMVYYNGCTNPDDLYSCTANCDEKNTYAVSEFGGPGLTYGDWVKAQGLDPAVLENHAKFVADKNRNPSGNMTGRTWSPDRHMSYDPIPWVGLTGRPQAVAQCNPTQVPDLDLTLYETRPRFTWRSTSGDNY